MHHELPPALLDEARGLQQARSQIDAELSRLLRGYFHAKELDPEKDHIKIDLQAGTYSVGDQEA